MKRAMTLIALGAFVVAGCGSDNETLPPAETSTDATVAAAPDTTEPSTEAPTTAAPATSAAPAPTTVAPATTVAPPESTTVNEGRAAAAGLAAADLPGWTQQPADDGDDDDDLQFDAPECAALKSLEDQPGLDDDADVALVSPDGKTQLQEGVTVGDPALVQMAFDAFADPSTAACLTALFTTVLSQPGQMPDGVTVTGVQFTQQPLTAGEQAIGYLAAITVTGDESGLSAPLGVRFDAVRAGPAIALLVTVSGPGADPVDPAAVAAAAGAKLAAAG